MKKIVFCIAICIFVAGCLFACAPTPSVDAPSVSEIPLIPDIPEEAFIPKAEEITISSVPAAQNPDPVEDQSEPTAKPTDPKAIYLASTVDGLNVRSGAGKNYAVLGTLDKGDMVKYVDEKDGWGETVYRGKRAFVFTEYVVKVYMDKADEGTEKVISIGCDLLGTPYVYGAARLHDGKGNFYKSFTKTAFDCSSLMQYIFYYGRGVLIDVNTRTQVKQGVAVERADLRRGDLMFFTNSSRKNKTGLERIGHVALYLGDNYILHTASDHAVIERISAVRWNYYICARRIA